MIKDDIDFEYAFEQIKRDLNTEVYTQGEILDSDSFNTSFKTIESNLNTLYENTRNLENMIKYCKTFLSIKIDKYKKDTKAILELIEDVRDINKNMSYIDYPVSLVSQSRNYKDRDGSILPKCKIQNGKIIFGNSHEEYIAFNGSCSRKSLSIPYRENLKDFGADPYRVTYIEDKIHTNGLTERITINFLAPVTINNLNIDTSNCDIKNIVYRYINGTEEYQENYETGYTTKKSITSITFDLVCKNYRHSTYKINKDKTTDNTWDKIKEYEYNDIINATTQIEIDELVEIIRNNSKVSFNKDDIKNIQSINKYTYRFGIDNIELSYVTQHDNSCFVSDEINIGKLNSDEYININASFKSLDGSTIEYYIIDGNKEISILPLISNQVFNEKIFTNTDLRFVKDYDDDYKIKKDGYLINMSLEEALTQSTGNYSIDYKPNLNEAYSYTPINSSIRIKAVLRKYNDFAEMPYIESIKIRKFGGAAPWIERL